MGNKFVVSKDYNAAMAVHVSVYADKRADQLRIVQYVYIRSTVDCIVNIINSGNDVFT